MLYIKERRWDSISTPAQACWMLRKVLESRTILKQVGCHYTARMSLTRQIYTQLLAPPTIRAPWKCLLFSNHVRPTATFTLWLQIHGRLLTADRLHKWGMVLESKCSLCQTCDENREHLYVTCPFARDMVDRLLNWIHQQPLTGNT